MRQSRKTSKHIFTWDRPIGEIAKEREKVKSSLLVVCKSSEKVLSPEKRIPPQKDDKVLTDWNGLMTAFARLPALGDKSYLAIACEAADFCLTNLKTDEGHLLKRWRLGKAGFPSFRRLCLFLSGLLDLYEEPWQASTSSKPRH